MAAVPCHTAHRDREQPQGRPAAVIDTVHQSGELVLREIRNRPFWSEPHEPYWTWQNRVFGTHMWKSRDWEADSSTGLRWCRPLPRDSACAKGKRPIRNVHSLA